MSITGEDAAEARFIQEPFNPLMKIRRMCHGDSCKGWARAGREFKKKFGVGYGTSGRFKAGSVTDCLAQFTQLALQPPSQWAEPDHRGIQSSKHLEIEIALLNMCGLMRQNHAKFFFVPFRVIVRQQDSRADVYWRSNLTAPAHLNSIGNLKIRSALDAPCLRPQAKR